MARSLNCRRLSDAPPPRAEAGTPLVPPHPIFREALQERRGFVPVVPLSSAKTRSGSRFEYSPSPTVLGDQDAPDCLNDPFVNLHPLSLPSCEAKQ